MKRFFRAFVFAGQGVVHALCSQPNFRLEVPACVAVIPAGFFFDITRWEWMICVLCMGAVLVAELINTGLEALTDLVSPEIHPLAGKAKDAAAAAVLVAAVASAVVGLIIFVPYITRWING